MVLVKNEISFFKIHIILIMYNLCNTREKENNRKNILFCITYLLARERGCVAYQQYCAFRLHYYNILFGLNGSA